MINNPYEQYRQQGVLTASPGELVVMLYEGCIKQLKLAKIFIGEKSLDKANFALQRAQDIVTELVMGLDFNYDMAREMLNLYEFIQHELTQVNIEKNVGRIDPVIEMLDELRLAWIEAVKKARAVNFAPEDDE